MTTDAVVDYVDIELKDIIPDDMKEELLAKHYAAVANAVERGKHKGIAAATATKRVRPNKDIPIPEEHSYIILVLGVLLFVALVGWGTSACCVG